MPRIIVITSSEVLEKPVERPVITCKFVIDSGAYKQISRIPNKFGYLDDELNLSVGNGDGAQVSARLGQDADAEWSQKVIDALPDCCILMSSKAFDSWFAHANACGFEYEHHSYDFSLSTS